MTEEQIAAIGADVSGAESGAGAAGARYAVVLRTKDVRRLLAEREQLLDAVREATAMVDQNKYAATIAGLLGVVAFAEEEVK